MFWMRYDKATGDIPKIGDTVETCHLGEGSVDGQWHGVFTGWSTIENNIGIVILSEPMPTGALALTMPVVCLRLRETV